MNTLTDTLTPGTVIQNTYEITKLLGEGGMGATFAGRNLATEHDVAIKVISAAFSENKRAIDLFKREANLLRTIQHEAVVRYETTLQDKDGRLFLVMEMLEGQPLSYYVNNGARLTSEDVLTLGRRLAGGLDAIAAVGTVHRDIAPDNIFVPDGEIQQAKLIDFGLASNTVGTEKSILGDDFAGKFSYCAPEQLGLFDNRVSPKTDAYALGLVLLKIAGLPVPGEGKGLGAGPARRDDLQIPNTTISPALHGVLTALLKADPDERPSPITPLFEAALAKTGRKQDRSDQTEIAVEKVKTNKQGSKTGLYLIGGVVGLAILAGVGHQFLPGLTEGEGRARVEGEIGIEALAAEDPLAETRGLIEAGGETNLNAAFGALLTYGREATNSDQDRITALILAAEMADPQTHGSVATPFEAPDPGLARRIYNQAADLGSQPAADAAARLEE